MAQNNESNIYASSPYNFISLPQNIVYRYEDIQDIPKHDLYYSNLNTGKIDYTITLKSPLYVGGNKDEFFNIENEYIIPGSTLRGKIRSNAEIISYSKPHFIEDRRIWFRGLADRNKIVRDQYVRELKGYTDANIKDSVKAGYLVQKNGNFEIIEAKSDQYGYTFEDIREDRLRSIGIGLDDSIFMYTKKLNWNEVEEIRKTVKDKNQKSRAIADKLRSFKNFSFKAYHIEVMYEVDEKSNRIIRIEKFKNQQLSETIKKGYLMNSNNIGSKQRHYLVYEENNKIKYELNPHIIAEFEVNTKFNQNLQDYYKLDKIGDKKRPVFYKTNKTNKEDIEIVVFGFTPYLKIPHKNRLRHGIPNFEASYEKEQYLDYVESIFGFTNEISAYQGRVFFENARLENYRIDELKMKKYQRVLSSPKITSFQLYLKQTDNKNIITYSDDTFEIRGRKFYWLKNGELKEVVENTAQNLKNNNSKVGTTLEAIEQLDKNNKEVKFKATVRFENLNDDELGLLLYSIKPFPDGSENIGKGKPYGFGKVVFNIDKISIEKEFEDRFRLFERKDASNILEKNILEENISQYRQKFESKFEELYKKEYNEILKFKENYIMWQFYWSKQSEIEVNNENYNYMELSAFKSRNKLEDMELISKHKVDKQEMKIQKIKELTKSLRSSSSSESTEQEILRNSNILVISLDELSEKNIRPAIGDFKNIKYILLEDEMEVQKFGYDAIILNSIPGDGAKKIEIENIMQQNKECAYIYFHRTARSMMNTNDYIFTFSNTEVTLFNAVTSALRYKKNKDR